ncbi:MAG: hypothetical protein DF168_01462 [Candidatus Moanabacter tarae]|uniref:DUF374 domain-containing protein n=1 Tax=Candidatus Moanibacter tarae TaxID=2200854 RepID=A0A2Z4ADD2_9BACT|nr:MAG: hypothetical protein DF168_01462 [Candidatus Moanabacter tarae]|tara:strand:- start:977 stop:1666 length:690 start_codon:yes stop_codon:yes gene_type:complete
MKSFENALPAASNEKNPHINRISGWRRVLLWPLSILIRVWSATTEIVISTEDKALLSDISQPVVILLWHNRLFLATQIFQKFRRQSKIWGLVSTSQDGAWLAAFFSLVGIGSVRGSTSHRAFGATRELLARFNCGSDIGITPDGPKGPRYKFGRGVVRIVRKTGAPLLLISGKIDRFWSFNSWDGFLLPKPFSKIYLRVSRIESFDDLQAKSEPEAAEILRQKLNDLSL